MLFVDVGVGAVGVVVTLGRDGGAEAGAGPVLFLLGFVFWGK